MIMHGHVERLLKSQEVTSSPAEFMHFSESSSPHLCGCLCVFKYLQEFSRRALSKINELVQMEEQSEVPATRETQRAYKEASIKAGASSH